MTTKVLVLGCGPSGLIAAYAARREFNAEVKIVSVRRPSQLFGCQYLHEDLPGLGLDESHMVTYRLIGDTEDYRRKVYGSLTPPVSPQQYAGDHRAWNLRQAYGRLWQMFGSDVVDVRLTPTDIVPMLSDFMPDVCISSLPAPVLCQRGVEHNFGSINCWALGDAPELGQFVPFDIPDFTVTCDGRPGTSWYRTSNVFGHSTIEWPGHKRKPPFEGVVGFNKPLSTDCDCLSSVVRVGRYGRWQKGVLSHEAYNATVRAIKEWA
jgi:hypothetical protein